MSKRIVLGALAALLLWGCQEQRPNRSFVQELALRKDAFDGTWYYALTAVDSSYEASWVFPGKQDLFLHKIQWKVEKDFLYAYRTHAVTRGADRGLAYRTREEVGEPVAAFAISKHFDIRHSYSPTTGEEYNVIEENETDRLWYDREYMRVDWSANQINNFSYTRGDLFRALGFLEPEIQPVDFFVEDINSPFAPKFRDDDGDGIFDYIDIVHQVTLNPTGYEVHVIEQLTPAQMTIRSSFLRTPEERFGYFRNERGTYQDNYGETDFLDYFANRYNIWEQVHTDEECYAHDVCGAGSHCDLYHHKCTLPYEQRTEKPIVYTMTANFPDLYLDQVPLIANGWNQAFQATVNGLTGTAAKAAAEQAELAADVPKHRHAEAEAAAGYNYYFVANDGSYGVHNHDYAASLLRASITEVQKTSTPGEIVSITDVPNDQGNMVRVLWNAFPAEESSTDPIETYQVVRWDDALGEAGEWVIVGEVTANGMGRYALDVANDVNSIAIPITSEFMVLGIADEATHESQIAEGWSKDNIEPMAPPAAKYVSDSGELTWALSPSTDVKYYAIFRGEIGGALGVTPWANVSGVDTSVAVESGFRYGIAAVDFGENMSDPAALVVDVVNMINGIPVPATTALLGNAPNPFNPDTQIRYQLHEPANVTLTVFNVLGQPVRTLVTGNVVAGVHSTNWDGRNNSGLSVGTGAYLYVMTTESGFRATGRMLLLR